MDVTASLRLFGGSRRVCALTRDVVKAVGVTVRMSVAPTGQSAWLLAKRGRLSAQQLALIHATVSLELEREREAV